MPHFSPLISSRRILSLATLGLLAVGVARAQTPASFSAATAYPAGANSRPLGVAVADVNGDGRPDIVTANGSSSTVGVLLGQAGGSFTAVSTYSTGVDSWPAGVAVADVNGDGRPDIVTANAGSSTVGVLLGQAAGGFAAVSTYTNFITPGGVAVADLNGDSRPDIVTFESNSNTVGVLLGQAGGGFAAFVTYPAGANSHPLGVAVADVNSDSRPDIVTANAGSSTVGVLLGQAAGGFAAVSIYSTGVSSSPFGVVVADVNGDGWPDIITANNGPNCTAGVLLGQAGGGFAAVSTHSTGVNSRPRNVAVADVNGDSRPDIVTVHDGPNTVGVLLGQAGGGFAAISTYSVIGSASYSVAVTDVNGDNRPDIIIANYTNNIAEVLLNTGTFTPLATMAGAPAAMVALFPNPAHGSFAVQLPAAWAAAPVRAQLLNALGQVVSTQAVVLPAGESTLHFATTSLAAGVYLLRVQAGSHTLARRVAVE